MAAAVSVQLPVDGTFEILPVTVVVLPTVEVEVTVYSQGAVAVTPTVAGGPSNVTTTSNVDGAM